MTTEECDIVATLTPKPRKLSRIVELLTNLTAAVEKNESGVFSFHLYKDFDQEAGKEQLVLVEKYKDKAAYNLHAEMPEFQAMHKSFKDENASGYEFPEDWEYPEPDEWFPAGAGEKKE